ncbi:MAG TPA: MFS transporter [Candidatus Limnocylindrales bacterium]|nr:MFS transporter [Candidatus Limnocylindrales bacterium]
MDDLPRDSAREGAGPGNSLSVVREYIDQVRGAGRRARLYLAGLFLVGLGQSIFSLLLNLYLRRLGFTDSGIGQILSKLSLGAAVAAIPVAFVFRGAGARSVLVLAAGLLSLVYMLQTTITLPELLLLVSLLSGMVATVFRLSIAPVAMREGTATSRPFLFSAAFTVSFLSAIVGSTLGGWLPHLFRLFTVNDLLALRRSLYVAAGCTLLAVIPFNALRAGEPPRERGPRESIGAQIERGFALAWGYIREVGELDWILNLKLVLPSLMIGLGAGLIIPFLNLYFRDRFALSEANIGILFGVMQAFMVVGNLFGPAVSRRLGLVAGVVVTQLASVPFMVLLALSHSFPIVAAAFCLRSGLMNMNQPLTSHFAMEVVPERDHAMTNSLLSLSWFLAWSVSADIGGAMIERMGYTQPLLIAAGLYVGASVLYWYFFRDVEEGRVPRGEVEIPDA